jgi:hypothetical protein
MALLDFSSISGGFIILAIIIILIIFIYPKIHKKQIEKKEVAKSGRTAKAAYSALQAEEAEEKHVEAAEEAEGKQLPKGKAGKAGKQVEKTAEAVEEMEQAATKAQEVGVALVADLRNTTEAIKTNTQGKIAIETVGEREIASLETFEKRINFLNKHDEIDEDAKKYLGSELSNFSKHLNKQAEFETQAVEHQKKFCTHLRQSTQHFKPIASDAKSKIKELNRKEKREKKSFNKEIRRIKGAIRRKRMKLLAEKIKGRKGDKALIAELTKEIKMLKKNRNKLIFLQKQIIRANELIDLEISKLKGLVQKVIKISRAQKKEKRKINKREKRLNKKSKKLKDKREDVQKSVENFSKEGSSHGLALAFSKQINEYFEFYIEELNDDLQFEQLVKVFASDNLLALQVMKSFQYLLSSIVKSEEALEGAVQASLEIIAIMMTAEVQGSLAAQAEMLQGHIAKLDKESDIDKTIAALDQQTINEALVEIRQLNALIEKYKKIIVENEALHKSESQHLGNVMGKMMNRKIAIDEKYMNQTAKFGEKLQKRNAEAAAAYQQHVS